MARDPSPLKGTHTEGTFNPFSPHPDWGAPIKGALHNQFEIGMGFWQCAIGGGALSGTSPRVRRPVACAKRRGAASVAPPPKLWAGDAAPAPPASASEPCWALGSTKVTPRSVVFQFLTLATHRSRQKKNNGPSWVWIDFLLEVRCTLFGGSVIGGTLR